MPGIDRAGGVYPADGEDIAVPAVADQLGAADGPGWSSVVRSANECALSSARPEIIVVAAGEHLVLIGDPFVAVQPEVASVAPGLAGIDAAVVTDAADEKIAAGF